MRWAASDVSPSSHLAFHIPTLADFCLLFVLCFCLVLFFVVFWFLFCKCLGIPNSPRSLDLDDRQGLIARSAMQQKKERMQDQRCPLPKGCSQVCKVFAHKSWACHLQGGWQKDQSSREVRPRTSFSQSKVSFSPNSFSRFSGRPISDLLIIEVFAGTARLSITAREAGFRSLSVDKTCDRCTGAHIAIFDLTKRDDVESLKQIIFEERFNIVWIHFAPACGTCSRAREKQLHSLEARGISVPKPLRSDDEPLGFHWLSGVDKVRVDAANLTYLHTCELIEWAYSFDIACSIENPANSIFWLIPFVLALFKRLGGYETLFHNCCNGGLRRKLTKWWDTHGIFSELAAICDNDGSHEHLDWKPVTSDNKLNFPTSSEAAYPFLLCTRLIDSVKAHVTESGALDPQNLQEQIEVEDKNSHSFILGMLPRGKKFRHAATSRQVTIAC